MEVDLDDLGGADSLIGEKRCRPPGQDEVELLDGAGRRIRHGRGAEAAGCSPVFFGSALTNFGVEPFLEEFLRMTMPPLPRDSRRARHRRPLRPDFPPLSSRSRPT
jgi:peptide chain release factor 3